MTIKVYIKNLLVALADDDGVLLWISSGTCLHHNISQMKNEMVVLVEDMTMTRDKM